MPIARSLKYPRIHNEIVNSELLSLSATRDCEELRSGITLAQWIVMEKLDIEIDWNTPDDAAPIAMPVQDTAPTAMPDFASIVAESTSNAAVRGAGSIATGELAGVGFTSREGYITALRAGVPNHTYQTYITVLRTRYAMTSGDIAKLELPGPTVPSVLPNGKGIVHVATGPSVFDRPKAERTFVVAPTTTEAPTAPVTLTSGDIVAGAVAEGHYVLLGWGGTSGLTRGALVDALTAIGRASLAPSAPNARAQAGAIVAGLARQRLDVRSAPCTVAGQHKWTVGKVNHTGAVGDKYGDILLHVTLTGAVLTYTGDSALGEPIVAAYNARLAAEVYKSSDVTQWLVGILRWRLQGIKFGALGWLIPARHATEAQMLCTAVQSTKFGTDWMLPALPVATSDQLRDGIARGLTEEVTDLMGKLATERATAATSRSETRSGEIGPKRAQTFLTELRAIRGRVVSYGQILGERRVAAAATVIRNAIVELEGLLGADHSGISERFALIWEEIQRDQKAAA